jgi:hypothetical protein
VEWRWERWGEPTKTADRGWNGPFYGLVSRIPPVHAKKQGAKPDRLLDGNHRAILLGLQGRSEEPMAEERFLRGQATGELL